MSALDVPDAPTSLSGRFRDRIESKGARHGLVYPWWIPVISTVGLIGGAVVGAVPALRRRAATRWCCSPPR